MTVAVRETAASGSAAELARQAVAAGADLVLACGGDGTINEAACGMAHSPVPLGILPWGTGNVLARELGMPLQDLPAAARALLAARPRRIALGRAGGRYFLEMAGVGMDAQVLSRLSARAKERFGMASYFYTAIRELLFRRPPRFLLIAEGRRVEASYAVISKSQYYGPFRMIRETDFFSDRFHVYCFRSPSSWRYVRFAVAVLRGNVPSLPDAVCFPARNVCCESLAVDGRSVQFQVDGELVGPLPCAVEIVPDALTLLVPEKKLGGGGGPVSTPFANPKP